MNLLWRLALQGKNLMTACVYTLLKLRASPDMLPFSLCNKKRLAIRHMYRFLFPTIRSIPSYNIGKCVGQRNYQHPLVTRKIFISYPGSAYIRHIVFMSSYLSSLFSYLMPSSNVYIYIYIYVCIYTGCPRRNVPDFTRVFLMAKYTNISQNTYIQSYGDNGQ